MAIEDRFADCYAGGGVPGLDTPLERHVLVTPDDDDELTFRTRALNVSKDCEVAIVDKFGNSATLTLTKGDNFHRADKVLETGTTADAVIYACD